MKKWVITTVITLGIGVVSYFLKRTMSQVDRHDTEIREGREQSASKEDLKEQTKELKDDIRKIREDYTPGIPTRRTLMNAGRTLKKFVRTT